MKRAAVVVLVVACGLVGATAHATRPATLPASTSRYNRGDAPGRYRDAEGRVRRFALKDETPLFDGAGREIGRVREPVMLNVGAAKGMDLDGVPSPESYAWAWQTA